MPRLETPARRAVAIVGAVATLIGAVAGGMQLWQAITSDDPTPAAAIKVVSGLEPTMEWREFRRAHPEVGDPPLDPAVRGLVFTVNLKVDGMKGKTGRLRWRELDRGGAELKLPPGAPASMAIAPDADGSRFVQTIWAPIPDVVEVFVVEFSFVDHNGVTRDVARGREMEIGRY
jgi:hypothetical protein